MMFALAVFIEKGTILDDCHGECEVGRVPQLL
jgi:hypothetical protein